VWGLFQLVADYLNTDMLAEFEHNDHNDDMVGKSHQDDNFKTVSLVAA
jgi:hypothetical protein